MTNFLDWLTTSDSGLAADRLKDRHRLTQDEMRRASEALAPAYMLGLQRLAADTAGWSRLMREFSALGPDRTLAGFDPQSAAGATGLMDAFFGSHPLAEAVAREASTMSGIAPDVMLKMMPSFSMMTVQAMLRMMNPALLDEKSMPTDAAGPTLAELLRRSANAVEAFSQPSERVGRSRQPQPAAAMQSLFADALRGGFPWMAWPVAPPARSAEKTSLPNPFDPFQSVGGLLDAFARGLDGTPKQAALQPGPAPAAKTTEPLSGLPETGQTYQPDYARDIMALFDRYRPKSS